MTRIRIGIFLTILLGAMYAATGLFTSLRHFGIGSAVVATAVVAWGFVAYAEDRR